MANDLRHTLIAAKLDGKPLPNDTPASWFVGIGCRRCGIIYALEVSKENQNVNALTAAVQWVQANMGQCGAHPDSLVQMQPEVSREVVRTAALPRWASGSK